MFPAWISAITVSVFGSAIAVLGYIWQKTALAASGPKSRRFGYLLISRQWLFGLSLVLLSNTTSILALTIAPMSLTAPLSGITVLLNLLMTPYFLGEHLHMAIDLPVALLIVVGAACTSIFGPHKADSTDDRFLHDLLSSKSTVAWLTGSLVIVGFCEFEVRRGQKNACLAEPRLAGNTRFRGMLLNALIAAVCAGLASIGMKAFGGMARMGFRDGVCEGAVVVGFSLCAALFELNVINRGLSLYEQTAFMPVSKALTIISNTIVGLVVYEEYGELRENRRDPQRVLFLIGLGIITIGIFLLSFRRPPPSSVVGTKVPLLEA